MIDAALSKRYGGDSEGELALRKAIISACTQHLNAGLGDENLAKRICAKDEPTYWQAFSEVLIALQLRRIGFDLIHGTQGPDFLIELEGQRIWIEVICPEPMGIPPDWLTSESGKVHSVPHIQMLLRWTSAIKEKAEKLIGSKNERVKGYLSNGIVQKGDAYVVAVNARRLRSREPVLEGVSQLPFALEATFPVGPYEIMVDRATNEAVSSGHQHRPRIPKSNGAEVPTDTFLDPRFAPISAVWATDIDEHLLLDRRGPMALVHNPLAISPVPLRLFPVQTEYVVTIEGNHLLVDAIDGRLATNTKRGAQ
jgi:hypothetical protein